MEDLASHLDVLGQQSGLYKLYTQLSLCFPLNDTASKSQITTTLTQGLERLTASFPWVAGQVVNNSPEGYRIAAYQKTPRLVVKDAKLQNDMPTMDALRQAKFSAQMLDEAVVAPMNTLAAGDEGPAPVLAVQANFIEHGLLLTFVTQHNVMDMTGMAEVIRLFSKACHDEPFTPEEIRIGNLDRRNLIPFLDDSYAPGPELDYQIVKPAPTDSAPTETDAGPLSQCNWSYFLFSANSLNQLKSEALGSLAGTSKFASTDDVLSSFIWQGVTKARLPRLTPSQNTTFARAIDPRRYLDIPATYPGLVQNMTYHTSNIEQLVKEPVGVVAADMRQAVDPKTSSLAYATRALVTWFHRAEDKNSVGVTATLDLGKDIMLSSWAKYEFYDMDFNLGLGKPEAVRRPQFVPVESLFYLMPKRQDGEIAVLLCLRQEDLERLKADREFMRFAEYIG